VPPKVPDVPPPNDSGSESDTGSYEEPSEKKDSAKQNDIQTQRPSIPELHDPCILNKPGTTVTSVRSRKPISSLSSQMTYDDSSRKPSVSTDEGPRFRDGSIKETSHNSENNKPSNIVYPTIQPTSSVKPSSPVTPIVLGQSDTISETQSEVPPVIPPRAGPPTPPLRKASTNKSQEHPIQEDIPESPDIVIEGDNKDTEIVLSNLSVSEIVDVLNGQNFQKLAKICQEHTIDGKFLMTFSDEDLRNEPFNLTGFEIKKIEWLKKGNLPKV